MFRQFIGRPVHWLLALVALLGAMLVPSSTEARAVLQTRYLTMRTNLEVSDDQGFSRLQIECTRDLAGRTTSASLQYFRYPPEGGAPVDSIFQRVSPDACAIDRDLTTAQVRASFRNPRTGLQVSVRAIWQGTGDVETVRDVYQDPETETWYRYRSENRTANALVTYTSSLGDRATRQAGFDTTMYFVEEYELDR